MKRKTSYNKMVDAIKNYLKEYGNSHTTIIATPFKVEILEGLILTEIDNERTQYTK